MVVSLKDADDRIEAVDARLAGSRFEDVDLGGAVFTDVSLKGARFENVDMSHVAIVDANLTDMTIRGVLVSELFAVYEARR